MITNLWDTNPIYVWNLKLKQILVLAGNGNFYNEQTSQELRQFFSKIDLPLSLNKDDKFEERGYVLQDIVNEMGSRLGYRVTNGLYLLNGMRDYGLKKAWIKLYGASEI